MTVDSDDLGMVPELTVDLAEEIMDTSVDPTSCDRESDTDVQAPPTLEKVAVDVTIEEISALLWEVPSIQPQHCETLEPWASQKLGGQTSILAPAELAPLLGVQFPHNHGSRSRHRP